MYMFMCVYMCMCVYTYVSIYSEELSFSVLHFFYPSLQYYFPQRTA